MRAALILPLLLSACGGASQSDACKPGEVEGCVELPANRVIAIDGDTYEINGKRVRLSGWDSPETGNSAGCRKEHDLGLRAEGQAKLYVSAAKTVTFKLLGEDQYDRVVARIWLDGTDVGSLLESDGLARRVHRIDDKPDWCTGKGDTRT